MNQTQRESEWRQICNEFRVSGMSRKAFCQSRRIALSTLGYWPESKLSQAGEVAQPQKPGDGKLHHLTGHYPPDAHDYTP